MRDAGLASSAHFYFDFRDSLKQNVRGALCSLLTQLSAESDACCDILECLYSAHQAGSTEPSKDALKECLKSMLMLQDRGPIFIILDAIDECPNSAGTPSPRENVLELCGVAVGIVLFAPLYLRQQQTGGRHRERSLTFGNLYGFPS